ncbi:MAG: acyltransferase [Lachnospiraceae bacterium]|nr:acyltransferase [Lachnospiraceae bacterium]
MQITLTKDGQLLNGRLFSLDLVRFGACFMVVLYHYTVAFPVLQRYLSMFGRIGVFLFLMVSGASLFNRYAGNLNVGAFYKKRALNIYLPFYTAYFFAFLYFFIRQGFRNPFTAPLYMLPFTVLGIDGYFPPLGLDSFYLIGEWFLTVIIVLYALFPLWRKLFLKAPAAVLAATFVLRAVLAFWNPFPLPFGYDPVAALFPFTLGAYLIRLSSAKRDAEASRAFVPLAGAALFIAGLVIEYVLDFEDIGEIFTASGLYLLAVMLSGVLKAKIIRRFISFIASMTYEIFLVHHIVIAALIALIAADMNRPALVLGGVIVAVISVPAAYLVRKIAHFRLARNKAA